MKLIYLLILSFFIFLSTGHAQNLTVSTSGNVNIVLTNPKGKKVGHDPRTNEKLDEIHNATFIKKSLGSVQKDRPYVSTSTTKKLYIQDYDNPVALGDYSLEVIPVGGGSWFVTITGYDKDGNSNQQIKREGKSLTKPFKIDFKHTDKPLPNNTEDVLAYYIKRMKWKTIENTKYQ